MLKAGFIVNREKWALLRCDSSYGRCLQSTHTAELLSRIPPLNNGNIAAMMVYLYRLEKLDRSNLSLTELGDTVDQVEQILGTQTIPQI